MEIGAWIGLSALLLSGATLWNGSRKATIEDLARRISALERQVEERDREIAKLHEHTTECERQLQRYRADNERLMERLLAANPTIRRPKKDPMEHS